MNQNPTVKMFLAYALMENINCLGQEVAPGSLVLTAKSLASWPFEQFREVS